MKTDIDEIMAYHEIDALLITGAGKHNSAMVYFTGIGNITNADLIRVKDKEPVIFHSPIERGEADKTGLKTVSYLEYPLGKYIRMANGDKNKAIAYRYKDMLNDCGINSGRIALYGQLDFGTGYSIAKNLVEINSEIEIVDDSEVDILKTVRITKTTDEIDKIKNVGRATVEIVSQVKDFLSQHNVNNQTLIKKNGMPLTIGDVKRKINLWIAEKEIEDPKGVIFSIGKDSAIPHSSGSKNECLRLGETIIFDIFPCEYGGGYFYDFTRTWSLGYATEEVVKVYDCVLDVYRKIIGSLEINTPFSKYHNMACEHFIEEGYNTIKNHPETDNGYVHSIGHGLGLDIHENPFSGESASSLDLLEPGVVFTIEPGLYFPESGIGVRLENSFYCKQDGNFELLADYPMDLVIPMKNGN